MLEGVYIDRMYGSWRSWDWYQVSFLITWSGGPVRGGVGNTEGIGSMTHVGNDVWFGFPGWSQKE